MDSKKTSSLSKSAVVQVELTVWKAPKLLTRSMVGATGNGPYFGFNEDAVYAYSYSYSYSYS
jgi:hypothetical protein